MASQQLPSDPDVLGPHDIAPEETDRRESSLDLGDVQASSVGVALFKLFNGTAGRSLHLGVTDKDDVFDSDSDSDDEFDEEEESDSSRIHPASISKHSRKSQTSLTDDVYVPPQDLDTGRLAHVSSDSSIAPTLLQITPSSADSSDTNVSKLAQSVQSL